MSIKQKNSDTAAPKGSASDQYLRRFFEKDKKFWYTILTEEKNG